MKDGRGIRMKELAQKNRQRVKDYSEANPDVIKMDACIALNMSKVTLRNHLKALGLN